MGNVSADSAETSNRRMVSKGATANNLSMTSRVDMSNSRATRRNRVTRRRRGQTMPTKWGQWVMAIRTAHPACRNSLMRSVLVSLALDWADSDCFQISAISDEISKYDANINQISRLHSSLLNNVESGNANNQQLDNLVEDMRVTSSAIANRIKTLQRRPMPAKSAGQRKQQLEFVNKKFRDSLQRYQAEEKLYRDKYKERMARQFRIGEHYMHRRFTNFRL